MTLAAAARELAVSHPDLASILDQYGVPPLWGRDAGFPTLVLLILEQQVSLASARAAFNKLLARLGLPSDAELAPDAFLNLDDTALKAVGFSWQKAGYARGLATAIIEGRFQPAALAEKPDEEARAELLQLKGVGAWTADVYLLMALKRPDIWPRGDLALAASWQEVRGLSVRPTYDELAVTAEQWRPWRSVAARLLWLAYLARRGRAY